MIRKVSTIAAAALTIMGLGACGGGGTNPSTITQPTTPTAHTLPVRVSVFVPKAKSGSLSASRTRASSNSVKPQYLPTSVNSITFEQTVSAGSSVTGPPTILLTFGGANCTPAGGGQICTTFLQGALGQDAWSINSFTSGDGSGLALSTNTATLTVLTGVANVLIATLNPILHSLAFAPTGGSANATTLTTIPVVLQALDATGAVIIGPGIFVNSANVPTPISLTSSSPAVALQTAGGADATTTSTAASSNDLGQIVYDGTLLASSNPTVSALADGVPQATFTLALTLAAGGLSLPPSIAMGADQAVNTTSAPLQISEPGFGGTFSLTSFGDSCNGIVTFPETVGPGPTQTATVTQVGGGTCSIEVTDGVNTGTVQVYSTTIGITLQQHQRH